MSRKLNLKLPTSKEFLLQSPKFESLTSRNERRPSSSCSNLSIMKEKLDKTSKFLKAFECKEPEVTETRKDGEVSKEIQALKTKIAQLEREKICCMVGRRSTQNSSLSDRIGMNARINKVKCSIDEAVREDAEWEELWQLTFHGDKVFSQSLENEDYAGLLLKTFQFIDEVTDNKDWNRTCRTFSEKKERLLFPPNDCIKSTMASTARGNSLSESLDWSFNCQ